MLFKTRTKIWYILFFLYCHFFCNATSNHHIRSLLQFHNFSTFKLKKSVKISNFYQTLFISQSKSIHTNCITQRAKCAHRILQAIGCWRSFFPSNTPPTTILGLLAKALFAIVFAYNSAIFLIFALFGLGFVKNGIGVCFWGRMVWFLKAAWVFEEIGWEERSCFGLDFLINFCSRKPHSFLNSCCFKFFGKADKTITTTRVFRRFCINTRFLSKKTSNRL